MRNFRITALFAKYIGPFENLSLELKEKNNPDEAEVHVFTGENGTGKSTILYLLTAFPNRHLILPRIQRRYISDFKIETRYSYFAPYENKETFHFESIVTKFVNGQLVHQGNQNTAMQNYYNNVMKGNYQFHKCQFALFAYSGYRRIENSTLSNGIKELETIPLHNALNFNESIDPTQLLQWIANIKTKEALSLAKNDKIKADRYKNAIEKIEKAVYQITDLQIKFELEDDPLSVVLRIDKEKLDFGLLPDGLKSIISWIADLLMKMDRIQWEGEVEIFDRNFILLLDEIEVHLHPAWQRKILPVIKKLFKNAQIFISTHSPFIVGSVDGAWVYKLKKEGNISLLDGEPILSEDSNSYDTILEDIFGIRDQFGVDVTKKLKEFKIIKNKILTQNLSLNDPNFVLLVKDLSSQSIELANIIGMEMKQLKRLIGSEQL